MNGTALVITPAAQPLIPQPIERVFIFQGMTLQDPLPGRHAKRCRASHALMHPQIGNAKIEGPVYVGSQERWTYVPATGTNG
jgi:PRTRC genetic system protein C